MQAMVVPPGAKPVAIRSTGSVVTVVIALESRGTVVDFKADDGGVIQLIHENSAKGLMLDVTKTHRELLQKEADWMKFECDGYTTLVALDFTLDHPLPFDPKAGDKYSGQLLIPYREDGEKNPGRCELLVLHD